jgi:tetratricopeptide (TPR) repeat protein
MECSKFYESQKEFDKAVELAEKSIADNDNLSQETKGYVSELYAGQAYDMGNRQTKDWESRSLVALNNAIKYNPRNAMVYYHLAWLHLNLGRRTKDEKYLHQALGYLEKLHELMPSFTLADKLLENIRYELDNIQKSKQ